MMMRERRTLEASRSSALKRELNDEQLITLRELEKFGWELKFVRRPPFQPSIPVVFDADRKRYAVLEADGTLNENPGFTVRD